MMETSIGKIMIFTLFFLLLIGTVSAQLGGLLPCRDGEKRDCGSSVGICEFGKTTCTAGQFGSCEGGIGPEEAEICSDGLDNDCNGLVDECGFNTVSMILIGSGLFLLIVALILSRLGK